MRVLVHCCTLVLLMLLQARVYYNKALQMLLSLGTTAGMSDEVHTIRSDINRCISRTTTIALLCTLHMLQWHFVMHCCPFMKHYATLAAHKACLI
jgi:hypothetical protein